MVWVGIKYEPIIRFLNKVCLIEQVHIIRFLNKVCLIEQVIFLAFLFLFQNMSFLMYSQHTFWHNTLKFILNNNEEKYKIEHYTKYLFLKCTHIKADFLLRKRKLFIINFSN